MEIYQWLFRQNRFLVSDTGYFVFCNAQTQKESFDGRLDFDMTIVAHIGYTDWIEQALHDIYELLICEEAPGASAECEYCKYRHAGALIENNINFEKELPF